VPCSTSVGILQKHASSHLECQQKTGVTELPLFLTLRRERLDGSAKPKVASRFLCHGTGGSTEDSADRDVPAPSPVETRGAAQQHRSDERIHDHSQPGLCAPPGSAPGVECVTILEPGAGIDPSA